MTPKRQVLNNYALQLNQWKGAHVLEQTNTHGRGYKSFFCYTKRASVGGRSNLRVGSC